MANSLYNIEILMGVSKNMREQNEEWRKEVWREGRERQQRANELLRMFEQEYANLDQELKRLEQYAPNPQPRTIEKMPQAVTQGPRQHEPVQRKDGLEQLPDNQVRR